MIAPVGKSVGYCVCALYGDATARRPMEWGQEVHIFAGDDLDNCQSFLWD